MWVSEKKKKKKMTFYDVKLIGNIYDFFSNNSGVIFSELFWFTLFLCKNLLFLVSLCNSRFHEQMNVVCTNKQML